MKTSHKVFVVIAIALGIAINYLPTWLNSAMSDSYRRDTTTDETTGNEIEIMNLEKSGKLNLNGSSPAITSNNFLWILHETFNDLPANSSAGFKSNTVIATGTFFTSGSTTMIVGQAGVTFRQPPFPRSISMVINNASGTALVVGTNTYGQVVRERMILENGITSIGTTPWIYISSVTIYQTSMSINSTEYSTAFFAIGYSSNVGLVGDITSSTDVFRMSQNNSVSITTCIINSTYNYFACSDYDAVKDYNIWYGTRKTPVYGREQ